MSNHMARSVFFIIVVAKPRERSLRSPSAMMFYAGFPALGRRIANSVNPVMAMQHQREVRHPRMGFSTVPQLSAAAELGHQSGRASQSDSWIPSLRAATILAWLMSRGMSLG